MRRRIAVMGCFGVLSVIVPGSAVPAVRGDTVGVAAARAPRTLLATGPLRTGVVDVTPFLAPDARLNFAHVRAAGSTVVRLILYWRYVGLTSAQRPPNFQADNPADPNYQWGSFDRQVRLAVRAGLQPIVSINLAPQWAERGPVSLGDPGTRNPDPAEFAAFARAAARRYSGSFQGLPRVRYWQVWNEPNFSGFLNPQSPDLYREMVNAFAAAVHGVRKDNLVIAGGESPFGFPNVAVPPLQFMRDLLCESAGAVPRPTCNTKINFDIWAHHPYTTGGPRHHATNKDDVSLGDLPAMRKVLEAAIRAGHVTSRHRIQFWVTEFSWDSKPPDPLAVPTKVHARWVAEALYQMWKSGVSLVAWFQIRDEPLSASQFQSGLYSIRSAAANTDRPKLALRAFRFPFVAKPAAGGVYVWGRTPFSRPGAVVVQRRAGAWRTVATLRANRYGIFQARLNARGGPFRARHVKTRETSLPYALPEPPDRYYWPFGCGGILPCS
jgi:hypothetical protein